MHLRHRVQYRLRVDKVVPFLRQESSRPPSSLSKTQLYWSGSASYRMKQETLREPQGHLWHLIHFGNLTSFALQEAQLAKQDCARPAWRNDMHSASFGFEVRSPVREREALVLKLWEVTAVILSLPFHTFRWYDQLDWQVGRIARIMGQSSLSSVPRDTPMGVLKNPYQRGIMYLLRIQSCQICYGKSNYQISAHLDKVLPPQGPCSWRGVKLNKDNSQRICPELNHHNFPEGNIN